MQWRLLMKPFAFLIVAAIVVTPGAQALAQQAQTAKSNAASRAHASVPMSRDEGIQNVMPKQRSGATAIFRPRKRPCMATA